jgi:hypothetical protein
MWPLASTRDQTAILSNRSVHRSRRAASAGMETAAATPSPSMECLNMVQRFPTAPK